MVQYLVGVPTAFSFTSRDPEPAKLVSLRRSSNTVVVRQFAVRQARDRISARNQEALYQGKETDIIIRDLDTKVFI